MANSVKFKHSVAIRLARNIVAIAFIIGLVLTLLQILDDFRRHQHQIDQTMAQILRISKPLAIMAVDPLDARQVQVLADELLSVNFVQSVKIHREDVELFYQEQSSIQNTTSTRWLTSQLITSSKDYTIYLPTSKDVDASSILLTVMVDMDRAFQPFFHRALTRGMALLIGILLMTTLLIALLYVSLTRPFELLINQILSIAKHPDSKQMSVTLHPNQLNEFRAVGKVNAVLIKSFNELFAEQQSAIGALKLADQRLFYLIDQLPQLVVAQNEQGVILFANQRYLDFYGQTMESVGNCHLSGENGSSLEATHLDSIRAKTLATKVTTFVNELELTNHVGKKVPFSIQVARLEYFDQAATLFVATDISRQKKIQGHVDHLTHHDSLTGLPNKILLSKRIDQVLNTPVNSHEFHALLFLDLDHFKHINHALGYSVGDEVLKKVGLNLVTLVRKVDTVARLGGDEFAILVQSLSNDQTLAKNFVIKICHKIIESIHQPLIVNGHRLHLKASLGVVLFPISRETTEDLLRYADIALGEAKHNAYEQTMFFHPSMGELAKDVCLLETELYAALVNEQFELYFQPQVDLAGNIFGFEALIRWHHPERGMILPEQFVPQMESSGLILQSGEWIIRQSCQQVARWQAQGFWQPDWHLAVNVSVSQLYQDNFIALLQSSITEAQIDYPNVCIEITETVAVSKMALIKQRLQEIQELGSLVALDDFGTGYSAMSYLKELPFNILKLDRSLIDDLETNNKSYCVVRAIVEIASALQLIVIVEGVESQRQVEIANSIGHMYYQGFYFADPLSAEHLVDAYMQQDKLDD